MPATMKAEQVIVNDYLRDLGSDYVAVDDMGHIIARADKATLERSYPNANLFTGKDFPKNVTSPAQKGVDNPVLVNPPAGVATTPSGHPVSDALADDPTPEPGTRTHPRDDGTPYEGPAALDPTDAALNQIAAQSGTPIKDALAASAEANTEAENAGRHAKQDELQAEQVKALEKDGVKLADGSRFDHDGDGKTGGSKKRTSAADQSKNTSTAIGKDKDQGGKAAASKAKK